MDERVKTPLLSKRARIALIALFVVLTLPIFPLLAVNVPGLGVLLFADLSLRSVPLYLAFWADRIFYDAGELSPELMPLWVVLTGLWMSPLVVLAVRPVLWARRTWRKAFVGYCVAFVACTGVAAYWVFTHLGVFF